MANVIDLLQQAEDAIRYADSSVNDTLHTAAGNVAEIGLRLDVQAFCIDKMRIKELKEVLTGVHPDNYPRHLQIELIEFMVRYHPSRWHAQIFSPENPGATTHSATT